MRKNSLISHHPRTAHRITAVLLSLSLAGCYTAVRVAHPAEFVDANRPSHIWVTESDDSLLVIDNPQMRGDTLSGYVQGVYRTLSTHDIKLVRARTLNFGRTATLVSAAVLGAAAVARLTLEKDEPRECYGCVTVGPP